MSNSCAEPQNQDSSPNESPIWRMRWFILIIFAMCHLASIIFSIAALIMTKNLVTLVILGPLLLAMRPMIRYLFPQGDKQPKRGGGP